MTRTRSASRVSPGPGCPTTSVGWRIWRSFWMPAGAGCASRRTGTLFVTTWVHPAFPTSQETGYDHPQRLDDLGGKVLRVNSDGSIPSDNPHAGDDGARGEVYARGFRDPEGAVFHPETGRLWTIENGPRGGDELNAIVRGGNHGYPTITYGTEYSGDPVWDGLTAMDGMEQPGLLLEPVDRAVRIALLHGRSVSRVARQPVRGRHGRAVAQASDPRRRAGDLRGAAPGRSRATHPGRAPGAGGCALRPDLGGRGPVVAHHTHRVSPGFARVRRSRRDTGCAEWPRSRSHETHP